MCFFAHLCSFCRGLTCAFFLEEPVLLSGFLAWYPFIVFGGPTFPTDEHAKRWTFQHFFHVKECIVGDVNFLKVLVVKAPFHWRVVPFGDLLGGERFRTYSGDLNTSLVQPGKYRYVKGQCFLLRRTRSPTLRRRAGGFGRDVWRTSNSTSGSCCCC